MPTTPRSKLPFETTLRVRDRCLCLHAQRGARALARQFDDALRPLGITNWQFSLLMSLNRPQPPNMRAVADLLAMDRTTLTAALKPLERRRWVKLAEDPEDRRSRRIRLTAAGASLLARAVVVWEREHRALEARLGKKEAATLRRLLNDVLQAG